MLRVWAKVFIVFRDFFGGFLMLILDKVVVGIGRVFGLWDFYFFFVGFC